MMGARIEIRALWIRVCIRMWIRGGLQCEVGHDLDVL